MFAYETDELVEFYMKIAQGGTLRSFIEDTSGKGDMFRRLGPEGVRFVLCGIIIGIQQLHRNGLMHADLKLENVLIDNLGYPLLTDFGQCVFESKAGAGVRKGTLLYQAP